MNSVILLLFYWCTRKNASLSVRPVDKFLLNKITSCKLRFTIFLFHVERFGFELEVHQIFLGLIIVN